MSDKFTIEQIKAALRKFRFPLTDNAVVPLNDESVSSIIANLTKPVWKPMEGEVYFYPLASDGGYARWDGIQMVGNERPLTPGEVPALKMAIKYLERHREGEGGLILAKIKELTNV